LNCFDVEIVLFKTLRRVGCGWSYAISDSVCSWRIDIANIKKLGYSMVGGGLNKPSASPDVLLCCYRDQSFD